MTERPADRPELFDANYDPEFVITDEMVDEGALVLAHFEALDVSRDMMVREVYRAMARLCPTCNENQRR